MKAHAIQLHCRYLEGIFYFLYLRFKKEIDNQTNKLTNRRLLSKKKAENNHSIPKTQTFFFFFNLWVN